MDIWYCRIDALTLSPILTVTTVWNTRETGDRYFFGPDTSKRKRKKKRKKKREKERGGIQSIIREQEVNLIVLICHI